MNVTVERLRELFSYDPATGIVTRRIKCGQRGPIGMRVGVGNGKGYLGVQVDGHNCKLHRVIWMIHNGCEIPDGYQIDHINGVRSDNRICNLRLATNTDNQHNTPPKKVNKSGFKGVYWHVANRRWGACIRVGGRSKFLGLHASREEAAAAYDAAAKIHYGEFARLNFAA